MLCHDTEQQLREVWAAIERLNGRADLTMAAIGDLQAADASLQATVATFLADIATALTAEDPDIESVVGDINTAVEQLKAADPANATPPAPPAS
jgi:hypothetical protein